MIALKVMKGTQKHVIVHVCRAKSCTKRGAAELAVGLSAAFAHERVDADILRHDCFDLCKHACNVLVHIPGTEPRLYTQLHPRVAERFAQSIASEVKADERTPVGASER